MAVDKKRDSMHKIALITRAEGLSLFAFSAYMFNRFDLNWTWFFILWFAFDLSMLGYLYNNRVGATLYNTFHSLPIPLLLFILSFEYESEWMITVALAGIAHIGLDRTLGYGLKLDKGFTHTHLGRIGSKKKTASKA